jgi:hypothetical protein
MLVRHGVLRCTCMPAAYGSANGPHGTGGSLVRFVAGVELGKAEKRVDHSDAVSRPKGLPRGVAVPFHCASVPVRLRITTVTPKANHCRLVDRSGLKSNSNSNGEGAARPNGAKPIGHAVLSLLYSARCLWLRGRVCEEAATGPHSRRQCTCACVRATIGRRAASRPSLRAQLFVRWRIDLQPALFAFVR